MKRKQTKTQNTGRKNEIIKERGENERGKRKVCMKAMQKEGKNRTKYEKGQRVQGNVS